MPAFFPFYPVAATSLSEAAPDAQVVAQEPQVETADAAEAGPSQVPQQECNPDNPNHMSIIL